MILDVANKTKEQLSTLLASLPIALMPQPCQRRLQLIQELQVLYRVLVHILPHPMKFLLRPITIHHNSPALAVVLLMRR